MVSKAHGNMRVLCLLPFRRSCSDFVPSSLFLEKEGSKIIDILINGGSIVRRDGNLEIIWFMKSTETGLQFLAPGLTRRLGHL